MHENPELLIRNAQNGDNASFARIIDLYGEKVYRIALALTKDPVEAEEVSQLVFIKLWKNICKFKFRSSFYTWFFSLMHRTFLDWARSKKSRHTRFVPFDTTKALAAENGDMVDILEKSEIQDIIYGAIDKIPIKYRIILIYFDIEGMSYEEISQMTGLPSGTVKSRLCRARKILREKIGNIIPD